MGSLRVRAQETKTPLPGQGLRRIVRLLRRMSDPAFPPRPHAMSSAKKAYYRKWREGKRRQLTENNRRWRDKKRPVLRVRWAFRQRFNRIMYGDVIHPSERVRHLKKKYRMTLDDYRQRFDAQGGVCATCSLPEKRKGRERYLCVDHDHKTGKIRGLLCHDCNTALGNVHDNCDILRALIAYLHQHGV
jgi:hypothetical protein